MVSKWISKINTDNNVLLMISGIILLCCTIIGIYNIYLFIKAVTKYPCRSIDPNETYKLIEDNFACLGEYSKDEIISNITNELCKAYINSAIHNCNETDKRIKILNKLYQWIITGVLTSIICFMLLLYL